MFQSYAKSPGGNRPLRCIRLFRENLRSLTHVRVPLHAGTPNSFQTVPSKADHDNQETAGRSWESLDALFQRPLYTIWKVAYPTDEYVTQISVLPDEKATRLDTEHYEKAGEGGTNLSRVQ